MACALSVIILSDTLSLLLWIFSIALGSYFSFRYFSLKHALSRLNQDLCEIQMDLTQNRILNLPLPCRELEKFILSINNTLESIRRERLTYARHEREFQKQIENISHDLRTPLTVILGYLKWMKQEDSGMQAVSQKSASGQAEFLDIIEHNARAMERLVSQFYTFCLLNGQDYTPAMQELDFCRLLRESLAANYQILEKASIRPDCLLPEHPVPVLGDPEAFERIFANLFQNAGRYAHSFLHIRMEETKEGLVRVFFRNDSEKLTAQDIPHLFDRFYRSDPSRNRSSSGLGLTIAKSLAEKMGGFLEVKLEQDSFHCQAEPTQVLSHKQIQESPKKADDTSLTVCFILTMKLFRQ